MNGFDYFEKGLKQYADFKGRASRKEFWYFILFRLLIHLSVSIYAGIIESEVVLALGNMFFVLALFIPTLAVAVRRLHDSNKSGWFMLFALFPPAAIALFIFFLLRSTPGSNKYGLHPSYVEDDWEDEDEEDYLEDFGDRSLPTRGRNRRY